MLPAVAEVRCRLDPHPATTISAIRPHRILKHGKPSRWLKSQSISLPIIDHLNKMRPYGLGFPY